MSLALFLYADERCLRTLSCRPIAAWRSFGRRTVQGQAVERAHALAGSKPVRPGALDSLSLNGPIRAQRGPLRGVQSSSQRSSAYQKLQMIFPLVNIILRRLIIVVLRRVGRGRPAGNMHQVNTAVENHRWQPDLVGGTPALRCKPGSA